MLPTVWCTLLYYRYCAVQVWMYSRRFGREECPEVVEHMSCVLVASKKVDTMCHVASRSWMQCSCSLHHILARCLPAWWCSACGCGSACRVFDVETAGCCRLECTVVVALYRRCSCYKRRLASRPCMRVVVLAVVITTCRLCCGLSCEVGG